MEIPASTNPTTTQVKRRTNPRFRPLPPGMTSLGDFDNLLKNPHLAYPGEAPSPLKEPPVIWLKTEDGQWQPKFNVPGIAEETTQPRPVKEFLPMERDFVINVFANHVGAYLFGVDPLIFEDDGDGTVLVTNPEFAALPVYEPSTTDGDTNVPEL